MSQQSKGGKARARQQRNEALAKYYSNPNVCICCKSIIQVKDGQRVPEVRRKKFCNRTCSGAYKRGRPTGLKATRPKCLNCENPVGQTRHKYCSKTCSAQHRAEQSMLEQLGRTKGDLFSSRKNWQSARSSIQSMARSAFFANGGPSKCMECGYSKHVDVCHRRDVSDFPDDSTIAEINSLDNLIPLCKNHHWEFDNGYLEIEAGVGFEPTSAGI